MPFTQMWAAPRCFWRWRTLSDFERLDPMVAYPYGRLTRMGGSPVWAAHPYGRLITRMGSLPVWAVYPYGRLTRMGGSPVWGAHPYGRLTHMSGSPVVWAAHPYGRLTSMGGSQIDRYPRAHKGDIKIAASRAFHSCEPATGKLSSRILFWCELCHTR